MSRNTIIVQLDCDTKIFLSIILLIGLFTFARTEHLSRGNEKRTKGKGMRLELKRPKKQKQKQKKKQKRKQKIKTETKTKNAKLKQKYGLQRKGRNKSSRQTD